MMNRRQKIEDLTHIIAYCAVREKRYQAQAKAKYEHAWRAHIRGNLSEHQRLMDEREDCLHNKKVLQEEREEASAALRELCGDEEE